MDDRFKEIERQVSRLSTGANIHLVSNIIQNIRFNQYEIKDFFEIRKNRECVLCKAIEKFNSLVQEFHKSFEPLGDKGDKVSKKEFKTLVKGFHNLLKIEILMLLLSQDNLDCNHNCTKCKYQKICERLKQIIGE